MEKILKKQKDYFNEGHTKSLIFRIEQLRKLRQLIKAHEQDIIEALHKDLHKPSFESYITEVGYVLNSLKYTIKKLKKWMRQKRVKTPLYLLSTKSFIRHEPKGNVLIIGPYNYPFQLIMEPLIGAIAAGNTVILKPSEYAIHTEKVIQQMIGKHFNENYLYVVTGDESVSQALLDLKFDHIFFTGSTHVGQIVYEKASKHLTPVTLELGGKSPVIVDETANLKVAANRIVFGKFLNAGQTCIAPDYVYVHQSIVNDFVKALKKSIKRMYSNMDTFGHIINEKHFIRLTNLIDDKKVIEKPVIDQRRLLISPTLMMDVNWKDKVMQEEIFGPILPILAYDDIDEVIRLLQTKDKPLALYLFSNHKKTQEKVFTNVSFGGGAINDTIMHVSNPRLPFGGVGNSGIGAYHGYKSFETFSHQKSFIKRGTILDLPIVYPLYTKRKEKMIKKLLK